MTPAHHAASLLTLPGISHGFFGRSGGVSHGLYDSLNCGLGSKDDAAAVAENRSRVARRLDVDAARLLSLYQIHSAEAVIVDRPISRADLPRADALVTRVPGIAVGAMSADCAPILFADPEARVVAAAHAGWRGAVGGILESTVQAMESIGARRERIRAAIGPCIHQPAYEVGPEFEAAFIERDAGYARFFTKPEAGARCRFDLPGFIASRLSALDLHHVEQLGLCTYENESEFFSFRRSTHRNEPDYGRQISAIVVT